MEELEQEPQLDVTTCIDREFCIRQKSMWVMENAASMDHLQRIKINIEKRKLEVHELCMDGDDLRRWRLHTLSTHPLSAAARILREQHNCSSTSQAFCKFLEILRRYPRLVRKWSSEDTFRSFHLCEAPGHFVTALERFICTFHSRLKWHWEANSLNPHYEGTSACDMLLDDELITMDPRRWRFGRDNSGDITKWDDDYLTMIASEGQFDLITADGSLYTQDTPGEQEAKVLPLLEAEVNIALRLLREGGSFVMKIYTMFLPNTRRIIHGITSKFDCVYVFKPMCSKAGNSERYIVCCGFTAKSVKSSMEILECVLLGCEVYFSNLQCSAIQTNIATFNSVSKAELSTFRDRMLHEFKCRILTKFISEPDRESLLVNKAVVNPWIEMYGRNYVEKIRTISTRETAIQLLAKHFQDDMQTEYSLVENIEVEFAKYEIDFLEWSMEKLIDEKVIVLTQCYMELRHSLFTPPVLLHALRIIKPQAIIDFCSTLTPGGSSQYVHELEFSGKVIVDAAKMNGPKDWVWALSGVLNGVKDEKITQLDLIWTAPSIPFVLSRFSASVFATLLILFFKFRVLEGQRFAVFTMPNYPEDIPKNIGSFLATLPEIAIELGPLQCFTTISLLSMVHPYLFDFNRRQWRQLLSKILDGNSEDYKEV